MAASAIAIVKLMRPAQWVKNVFVLAPLFFSGQLMGRDAITDALIATAVFCLVSSAVYVFNDLTDIEADREHEKKRIRPLASGAVSVGTGRMLIALLLAAVGAVLLVWEPPRLFSAILGIYLVANAAYSLGFKQVALIELMLVSSGYVLRLIAGGIAIASPISGWIIVCTGLLALMLTIAKRRGDLAQNNDPQGHRASLAGYTIPFLDHLLSMLAGATLVAYVLFTIGGYAQGRFGDLVPVTAVFVVLGIFRFMQIVIVEGGGDSPTDLVLRDNFMRLTLAGWAATFFFLLYV